MRRRRGRLPRATVAVALLVGGSLSSVPTGLAAQQLPPARADAGWYEIAGVHGSYLREEVEDFSLGRGLFRRVAASHVVSGEVRLPVVLVLYADSPEEPHITTDDVQTALFDGPAPRGTVTESYLEMSLGQLTVAGDVYGWARSDLPLDSAMGTSGSLVGDRTGEFFFDALEQLDPDVDFTQYDNDGPDGIANSGDDDGYVDIITFEYLEIAASCGGPAIWPHRSRLSNREVESAFTTDDMGANGEPILINDYITQSAADCSGENVQDAAVIAHEFGHVVGLPDWYHWIDPTLGPSGRRWVLGCWALMAAGSWGCGPVGESREPYGPAHMVAFSKIEGDRVHFKDPNGAAIPGFGTRLGMGLRISRHLFRQFRCFPHPQSLPVRTTKAGTERLAFSPVELKYVQGYVCQY